MYQRLQALPSVLLLAAWSGAQATVQTDLSASFSVPAGCSVSLWAESPLFYNPTAIDIDPQGRVWVTEAVNYRQWDGRNPGRHHDAGDRVMVVEDRDGDGVAETSTVFAQDEDLVSPLGICWLPDKVLVSCSPTVWAYYDDDGDLHADRKEVFLTGFGGKNHDHGAHSFSIGPDGRLYMALGNAGPHIVTDTSGWTLRSGSIYDDGGPAPAGNRPGLVSDDGHVYVGGLILRCNTDGTGLAVMAHNFRNPYEVAVDAFGDMWTFDNDDDGNQCCRATWVMEGGNYGYFSADGSRTWEADRRPGQGVQRAHWHQDDPGVMPTTLLTGSGGPTGVCIYEGDALPEPLHGTLLCADAGRNCVYVLQRVPKGAGFELLPLEGAPAVNGLAPDGQLLTGLLVSRPTAHDDDSWRLFRPSDVCTAPDGSVIVADWFDPGVGGHQARDREAYGRLLRIAGPPVEEPVGAVPTGSVVASWIDRLASAAQSERAEAWMRLAGLADAPLELLSRARSDAGQPVEARARVAQLEAAIRGEPVNTFWRSGKLVSQRDWALQLRDEPPKPAFEDRWKSLQPDDAGEAAAALDRTWLEAVALAFEMAREAWRPWRDVEPPPGPGAPPARREVAWQDWTEGEAALAWRLHPEALVGAFLARARSSLDHAARVQSLEALGFCSSREAGEAVLTLALAGPEDTRDLAAWWVEHNDADAWRDFGLLEHLAGSGAWTDDQILWRSGPLTSGSVPVRVNLTGSRRFALAVTAAGDGNSCDWADWIEPRVDSLQGDAGETWDLAAEPPAFTSASAEWGSVQLGRNCAGGPLLVEGVNWARGIGTHAESWIVFDRGREPGELGILTAIGALDDGGTRQPGAPTSVEFLVYGDLAVEREAEQAREALGRSALLSTLRSATADFEARLAAAEELAADAQGGALLLREAAVGHLAELQPSDVRDELLDTIGEALFRNPDLGVRALASEHFRRPGAPSLPPIADLAALSGDRRSGQALFFGTARCSACHAVRGRGGDVGPDLSQIRTKYGRAELLDAILNPSASIGAGLQSLTLTLRDGRVLAGLLMADGGTLLLKDGTGTRHVVDADDVVERRASRLSLMPDDIARTLQPQQLADLCAFLQHDPDAPPTLGQPQPLWNGRDLDGWIPVPDDSAWSVREADGTPVLHCEGQPIGYIRTARAFTSFELTVEWRFPDPGHPGNSGVLLRVQAPDGVWPRSLEAQLNSGDAGDIWNIRDFGAELDPSRTEGRRTVKLLFSSEKPLGQWNTYRITLRDGDLTLDVNGQVQNRARWCEELPGSIALQSEGAPIEFRRVELREIGE